MQPETTPQQLDDLALFSLCEDPHRWERLIEAENENAKTNEIAAKVLESVYWELDREQAFRRFHQSLDFQCILKLIKILGIQESDRIVEIGGGSGFLSWALCKEGYQKVSLLEPNPNYITGTGYLQTRKDADHITIEHSLDAFYASNETYNTVITRNCVHHFPCITFVAASIRQKMAPGGKWLMVREPFVETSDDLYRFLQGHPYSQAYGVYEMGFPASHFIQSLELAGLRLVSVVPQYYANDSLGNYTNDRGNRLNRSFTSLVDRVLQTMPGATLLGYRIEHLLRKVFQTRIACFTRPQVMVFERIELGEMPEGTVWYRPDGNTIAAVNRNVA